MQKLGFEEEAGEIDNLSLLDRAIKRYGITHAPEKAGYICPNGEMLDFSEGQGSRIIDHRHVEGLVENFNEFENRSATMRHFMREAECIRMGSYGNLLFLDVENVPTHEQFSTIRYILKVQRPEIVELSPIGSTGQIIEIAWPNMDRIKGAIRGGHV